uniref:Retrovirus-related Pol polyprotein from transposon TNT 1-94 n=1 Tax=Cajanus cajan TaxID=3821 RepID=A0A151S4N8_CAJCA|nr:Retrovirus-related Pol polyprotein from transposon TNT 1-94 [Cajanus cajan]
MLAFIAHKIIKLFQMDVKSQQKYTKELIQKFKMNDCKPMPTPMHLSVGLGMIRSLLYLATSRPNIMFNICLCARFQCDPKESHLKFAKQIFRYLVGSTNLSLFYERNNSFRLTRFYDVDYVGDKIERNSTSRGCHFLGNYYLMSWSSKKQNSIALSTIEVEYISAVICCSQLLWMKYQLKDYSSLKSNILIFCDNTSAINLSKYPIQHSKAMHIEIRYHFICDHVQKRVFNITFIDTNYKWDDIFTKALAEECFNFIKEHLNLKCLLD